MTNSALTFVGPPEVFLYNSNGVQLRSLADHTYLKYTGVCNGIGELDIILPARITPDDLPQDCYIVVSRMVTDLRTGLSTPKVDMETIWFIEYVQCRSLGKLGTGSGAYETEFKAYPAISLLARRMIAYRLGATQARYATLTPSDNIMKSIVFYNLGAGANQATGVTQTGGSSNFSVIGRVIPNFTIEANLNLGPTVQSTVSWKPVIQVLQDLAKASEQKLTPVYFDIVLSDAVTFPPTLIFKTYVNTRGSDRSATGISTLPFSEESGNIIGPVWTRDRTKEINAEYLLGMGSESTQLVVEAEDTQRILGSPYNRRESVTSAKQHSSINAGIQQEALAAVSAGRTKDWIEATVANNDVLQYLRDWELGSLVPTSMFDRAFDARIETVQVTLSKGVETILAQFKNTSLIV